MGWRAVSVLILVEACTAPVCGGESGRIRADDGVSIAYTSHGEGETAIILVHGWTCDSAYWRLQVPEFRKSFRVITIDLPGHGSSGAERESWSIDGLGADVAAVVRGLRLNNVVLVGHSMGGAVVLAAASKLRGIVRGVVAVDSLQNVEFVAPSDAVDRILTRFESDFEVAWKRFMSAFFADRDSATLKWILSRGDAFDQKAALSLLRAYNEFDAKAALEAAGVPVRGINAADPFPTEIQINRKYGDFDAALMQEVGHFLMLEEPEEFNQRLRTVLQRLAGP